MSCTVICRWGGARHAGKGGTHRQVPAHRAQYAGKAARQIRDSKAGGHCWHRRNGRSYRWAGLVAKQVRKEGGWTRLVGQAGKEDLRHSRQHNAGRQTLTLSFIDTLSPTHLSTATGHTQTPSSYTPFVCIFSKLKTQNMIHSVFLCKQHTN
jgi:hypothetical protein